MRDPQRKALTDHAEIPAQVEGYGTGKHDHRGPELAQNDADIAADAAEAVAVAARARAARSIRNKKSKPGEYYLAAGRRAGRSRLSRQSPATASVYRDALAAMSVIKENHLDMFNETPKELRRQINRACSGVFSLKRGPKPNPDIASAVRDVAAGASVEDVFRRQYPGLKNSNPEWYAMSLATFRTKVSARTRRERPQPPNNMP